MGYGLPAAIAAKSTNPWRTVVALAGDGCLQMTLQELATAAQAGLAIIVLVVNNGMLGTIRMHQERTYPGRTVATTLSNPDFVALASAYGFHAERITTSVDFADAFARAQASGRPALIEIPTDPEALTPTATLSGVREAAQTARQQSS
jgi:acetolactate synthase I/II/III large subunit